MGDLVCVVDLGSTMIKAALIDERGEVVSLARAEAPVTEGKHAVFAAESCYSAACGAIGRALEDGSGEDRNIRAVSLTSQRASLVCVGAEGVADGPAFSWQGVGCQAASDRFYEAFGGHRFRSITGLRPGPIYTAAKLAYLREAEPERFASADRFVLLHDYVLHRLGAEDFFTDPSNGSASGLFDTPRGRWSEELLDALDVSRDRLPLLVEAGTRVGALSPTAARDTGLASETPLVVGGGDQQCAAAGAGVFPGSCAVSMGTVAVVLCPVENPIDPEIGGVLCTAHIVPGQWMIEGFQSSFGSAFRWAGNLIGTSSLAELTQLAGKAPFGSDDLLYLPFLSGIGSPDFDGTARAGWLGATLEHRREHLARAVVEGVALELRRVLDEVSNCVQIESLIAVGGGTLDRELLQTVADITGMELSPLGQVEGALLGAAAAAWVGADRFENLEEAIGQLGRQRAPTVRPGSARGEIDALYARYRHAVDTVRQFPGACS